MIMYKFVSWDTISKEDAMKANAAIAMQKADHGDKNAVRDYYYSHADNTELLRTSVVKCMGWAYSFREYCNRYFVKTRYYGIQECYAPNKTCIRKAYGHEVIEIVQVS